MSLLATDNQRFGPGSGGITGRGWKPGQSGNAAGRPKAPVDIAALAREHGPRCIEVAAALLDDPDPRIRLGALNALLDRGFGKPVQAIAADPDARPTLQFQHLIAAQAMSTMLQAELAASPPTIDAEQQHRPNGHLSLCTPALE